MIDWNAPNLNATIQHKDGYKTGFDWTANYHPGGPFILRAGPSLYQSENSPGMIMERLSREAHQAWHRGFYQGKRDRALYDVIRPKKPRRTSLCSVLRHVA